MVKSSGSGCGVGLRKLVLSSSLQLMNFLSFTKKINIIDSLSNFCPTMYWGGTLKMLYLHKICKSL